jgi:hypothetical protein
MARRPRQINPAGHRLSIALRAERTVHHGVRPTGVRGAKTLRRGAVCLF